MRRLLVAVTLAALAALAVPRPAAAGASTEAALALGAFAVLNQMVRGETILHGFFGRPPVVVHTPPRAVHAPRVIHAPPPVVHAPPPPVVRRAPVIAYPHGILTRGHWVWVAKPRGHPQHRHRR